MASNISSQLSTFEIDLVNRVHSHFPNSQPTKFRFFYENTSPYSNFYSCKVIENGIEFNCTEQYMMYHKAKLFNDDKIAEEILKSTKPRQCKGLGRKIKNFDDKIWVENRTRIVSEGNYLKFTQNADLKELLLSQKDKLFVEASPSDCIWGVGLAEDNPLIKQRSNWRGLNLLGYLLTDIAFRLRSENESV